MTTKDTPSLRQLMSFVLLINRLTIDGAIKWIVTQPPQGMYFPNLAAYFETTHADRILGLFETYRPAATTISGSANVAFPDDDYGRYVTASGIAVSSTNPIVVQLAILNQDRQIELMLPHDFQGLRELATTVRAKTSQVYNYIDSVLKGSQEDS